MKIYFENWNRPKIKTRQACFLKHVDILCKDDEFDISMEK